MSFLRQTHWLFSRPAMLAACAALALSAASHAAGDPKTITGAKSETVKLYKAPGETQSSKSVPTEKVLQKIQDEKNGYYKVTVDNTPYWVDSMDVRTSRASNAPCTAAANVHIAGSLGAQTNRCGP
jgi:hypothetical protein